MSGTSIAASPQIRKVSATRANCSALPERQPIRPPRRYLTVSPLEGVQIAKSKKRKRILTDDELRKIWFATFEMEGNFSAIVRLLILMGQRRGEPLPSPPLTIPIINSASPCRAN
jgi:integrase